LAESLRNGSPTMFLVHSLSTGGIGGKSGLGFSGAFPPP
jgi:hypothetical protein